MQPLSTPEQRGLILDILDATCNQLHQAHHHVTLLETFTHRDFDETIGAIALAIGSVDRASASLRKLLPLPTLPTDAKAVLDRLLPQSMDASFIGGYLTEKEKRAAYDADHQLRRGEGPDTTLRVKPCPRCGLSVETRWYPNHIEPCNAMCDHGASEVHTCEHGLPCKKVAAIDAHCTQCQAGWRGAL